MSYLHLFLISMGTAHLASSFSPHEMMRNSPRRSSQRQQSLTILQGASQNFMDRRNLLVSGSLIAASAGLVVVGVTTSSTSTPIPSMTAVSDEPGADDKAVIMPSITRLVSVQQAVDWIDTSCDRRFLHAVAATNFEHLLYRGMDETDDEASTIRQEPCDLLDPATYDSKAALEFFWNLEKGAMRDKPVRPSNGHLATTSPASAAIWGGAAASIWPLEGDVHFSWLAEGGEFWPSSGPSPSSSYSFLQENDVIVDGIDCGRMNLEDALERDNSEIMFCAQAFLAVPTSLEKQLVAQLRNSFII